MSEIVIPAIPAGVTLLLNFFAPYLVAIVVNPRWSATQKKIASIAVAVALAAAVLLLAFFGFGIAIPAWPALILLAVVVTQASYDLVTKASADRLAKSAGTGRHSL